MNEHTKRSGESAAKRRGSGLFGMIRDRQKLAEEKLRKQDQQRKGNNLSGPTVKFQVVYRGYRPGLPGVTAKEVKVLLVSPKPKRREKDGVVVTTVLLDSKE